MSNKKIIVKGFGVEILLFVVFLVLKLTGSITWSWIWVFAPLWIGIACAMVAAIILMVYLLLLVKISPNNVKIERDGDSIKFLYSKTKKGTLPYGVFIILKDGTHISKDEYDKDKHEARGILIHSENLCHELDLFDHPEPMPWDEAVKHSIPSKEQWKEISKHREEVEEIIKLTGGDTLKYKWHWSSTEFCSNTSWYSNGTNCYLGKGNKSNTDRVRPFKPFKL